MNNPSVTPRTADRAVPTASAIETAEAAPLAAGWAPGVVAARLRRGVELGNGRIIGETDRVVHLLPIPTSGPMPDHLMALCGLEIQPGHAEHVAVRTGMPCIPCLNGVPRPGDAEVSEATDPR